MLSRRLFPKVKFTPAADTAVCMHSRWCHAACSLLHMTEVRGWPRLGSIQACLGVEEYEVAQSQARHHSKEVADIVCHHCQHEQVGYEDVHPIEGRGH